MPKIHIEIFKSALLDMGLDEQNMFNLHFDYCGTFVNYFIKLVCYFKDVRLISPTSR